MEALGTYLTEKQEVADRAASWLILNLPTIPMSPMTCNQSPCGAGTAKGSLDIKYLSERYAKGTKQVNEYMTTHQRYVQLDSLDSGLPDAISHLQTRAGPNKFLGGCFHEVTRGVVSLKACGCFHHLPSNHR